MARVYRDVRANRIEAKTGSACVYMLSQIGKMIETSLVEKRIDQLERTIQE